MAKTIKPELLGGFQDFLPEDMIARDGIIGTIRQIYESFGFLPLDTPCMEGRPILFGDSKDFNKSVFMARIVRGLEDGGEAVGEDEDFALRFDLTVSLARVAAAYPDLPKPFKRYQNGKVWRGEKPQRGRSREFMQFDIDTIGSKSMLADTEIIQVMYVVMKKLVRDRFLIKFNNRKILNGVAEILGCQAVAKNLYRIVDKVEKIGVEKVIEELLRKPDNQYDETAVALSPDKVGLVRTFLTIKGMSISNTLDAVTELFGNQTASGSEGIDELREIASNLSTLNITEDVCHVDLSVARGLDYYTGPVFETSLIDMPEIGSVFSGGRFDGLSDRFMPGSNISGVGASVGVDRLIAALRELNLLKTRRSTASVLVTIFGKQFVRESFNFSCALRSRGVSAELFVDDLPLKAQIAYAAKQGIPYIVIIGEDEVKAGVAVLKDMTARTQEKLTAEQIYATLVEKGFVPS
jgi:histidyl-tRNA synthetase